MERQPSKGLDRGKNVKKTGNMPIYGRKKKKNKAFDKVRRHLMRFLKDNL